MFCIAEVTFMCWEDVLKQEKSHKALRDIALRAIDGKLWKICNIKGHSFE